MSVDDETGYTTSEEQGDREDAVLSTASTPPIPSGENRFPGKASHVSASTRTLDCAFAAKVGIDKGMQCSPEPTLMVSSASQCEGPARISISAGVQCSMPAPVPPVSSCGSQCRSAIGTQAATGVQCSLLVEEDAEKFQGAKFAPVLVGVGSGGSLTDFPKEESEGACELNSDGRAVLPLSLGPSEQAQLTDVDDRGTGTKSKKKRRKPKATGAAVRPPTVEDATIRAPGASKTPRGGLGDWTRWRTRRLIVCGIVGFVLAAVWGTMGHSGGSRWQAGGVLTWYGAHEGQKERAQAPVWVTVGGSFTLGDGLASRRPKVQEGDAGEVQWFRDGRLLPGQIRWVECEIIGKAGIAGGGRAGRSMLWCGPRPVCYHLHVTFRNGHSSVTSLSSPGFVSNTPGQRSKKISLLPPLPHPGTTPSLSHLDGARLFFKEHG